MKRPILRVATMNDLEEIAALLGELGYAEASRDPRLSETLETVLTDADRGVWLATIDNRIVGMISLSMRPQLRLAGRLLTVEELVVSASARGLGVGSLLLEQAKVEARRIGARRVELLTNRTRPVYQRGFYPARGFVEVASAVMRWSPHD